MQSTVSLYGVLIADVVASRSTSNLRSSLNEKLRIASIAQLDEQLIRIPYAVTAGDEFQVVAARLERIPKLILDLRRRLLPFRLRIGVGKYPTLTIFRSNHGSFDRVANLIYGLHDTLIRRTTAKQWETIAVYLIKNRVDHTAKALKIDRSTASRNLRRGFFWQMEDTALAMGQLIRESFGDCT